jgi:hypothetical protein
MYPQYNNDMLIKIKEKKVYLVVFLPLDLHLPSAKAEDILFSMMWNSMRKFLGSACHSKALTI